MAQTDSIPLVVDLDGTVIRTDLLWESLALLLRRNPLAIFQILFWWSRGRAWLKRQLVARVQVDPASLPYHQPFLNWLRQEKGAGRKIILATASDRRMAQPVADYLGLFDEVMGSDGKINLRRENKRLALVGKFGERGFDYAGNSGDDLFVWRSARVAVVVNASEQVKRAAAECAQLGPTFCEGYRLHAVGQRFLVGLFWRSGYLFAVGAGLLLVACFPKFNIAGFAWALPALMIGAAYGQKGGDSFRVGYLTGLTFWLGSLYWLLLMPAPVYSVVLGWLALSLFVALYFGLWVWLMAPLAPRLSGKPPQAADGSAASTRRPRPADSWVGRNLWALSGAAIWVAFEMVRARLLGGFPWSFLGVSQYQLVPLIQIAAITGVYGVSFLIVWFSLSLYSATVMIVQQPTQRHVWHVEILLPLLVVLGCFVGGFFAVSGAIPPKNFLRVTAVQPSVPQTLIWDPADNARRFQELLVLSHQALTNQTTPSDLLVWPESAVPALDDATCEAIVHFAQSNHIWIVLNGEDVEVRPQATNYFNAAFLVGPDGRWRQAYHKRELVIFGEYVPLADWLPFLKWLTPITGGWTPGDKAATFVLERRPEAGVIQITTNASSAGSTTVRCAPLICFEDTFPTTARDSAQDDVDFLVNMTNDGWFRESAEQWQHAANAIFRAVENGRPLLRCANNGITCLINRHGRMERVFHGAHDSEYASGAETFEVPLRDATDAAGHTFYNRHGDWFGWGCVVVSAALLARRLIIKTHL